jgi:hypothetical protein
MTPGGAQAHGQIRTVQWIKSPFGKRPSHGSQPITRGANGLRRGFPSGANHSDGYG